MVFSGPLLESVPPERLNVPLWAEPIAVPLNASPLIVPLVLPGARPPPEALPLRFVLAVAVKARLSDKLGAEFWTVKLTGVVPPVMIEAAPRVGVIVPMVALCWRSR